MAKQIYIDENGNEQLVSGTINNAELLPIESGSATNTKDYIDIGLSGKADSSSIPDFSTYYQVKSKQLTAGNWKFDVVNQYQCVFVIGLVNGERVLYMFSPNDPTSVTKIQGNNTLPITKNSNTSFTINVGSSTDCYVFCNAYSISQVT